MKKNLAGLEVETVGGVKDGGGLIIVANAVKQNQRKKWQKGRTKKDYLKAKRPDKFYFWELCKEMQTWRGKKRNMGTGMVYLKATLLMH